MPVLTVTGGGGAGGGGVGAGGEMPKLKVVTFPRPSVSSSTVGGAAPIKLTVAHPPSASSSSASSTQAAESQQQQQQQLQQPVKEEDNMDEDEKALVDAEDTDGMVDKEMAAAVAGEAPVLLKEEGAIEAYTEARSEQQKQLEELKAKVKRGDGGRMGGGEGEGGTW